MSGLLAFKNASIFHDLWLAEIVDCMKPETQNRNWMVISIGVLFFEKLRYEPQTGNFQMS